MILTDDLLELVSGNNHRKDHFSRIEINTSRIIRSNSPIQSDTVFNNLDATLKLKEDLLGYEFKDEDVIIAEQRYVNEWNGYDLWFRKNNLPYLKGWTKSLGEALMLKDWMVK